MLKKYTRYRFLFEELVKRDFKKKYKRTVLGMLWSVLSPLLMLLVMRLVFTHFFAATSSTTPRSCSAATWCTPTSTNPRPRA